ncbi:hypothetical protein BST61_g8698 [Cercospora zeina]
MRTRRRRELGSYAHSRTFMALLPADQKPFAKTPTSMQAARIGSTLGTSQEPLLLAHADHLVARTRQCLLQEQKVHNVVALYTCVVADVISDMVLGDSIRTLDRLAFTPWLKTLLAITQTGVYLRLIRSSKLLALIISLYMRSGLARRQISDFKGFVEKHIDARLEADASRPDLWGLAATHLKDSKSLSREEMCNNALVFMLGGTETTASLLAGLTYLLLTHPEKMTRLTKEIRESFVDDADIILDNLRGLPYLNACIEEGLRLFPPTAIGLPRITPAGQVTIIDGHAVPGNTRVSVPLMALSHNPMYWTHPADFIPERWLDTAAQDPSPYAQDVREASQPFSMGRRACIGKSFAYHNIRLILSKLLWHFDLGLSRESEHWLPQKNYIVWERPPLNCSVALRSENSQATDGTE